MRVTGVTLAENAVALAPDSTCRLTAVVAPENAASKAVAWHSTAESVASVSETGLVTAVSTGAAFIVVTTVDGGFTDTCTVTVDQQVTGVLLDRDTATLAPAATLQLTAVVAPAHAGIKGVAWRSTVEAVATVSKAGLVTAVSTGAAFIVVTTEDGGFTDTCTVAVADGLSLALENTRLRLEQDLTRGGAISYISLAGSERNLVNTADEGRYIQQSYYAGRLVDRQEEGQSPAWSPWSWNPIQCGDYARNRAQLLETRQAVGNTYVKCIPMQWDMDNRPAEAIMEQWTSLADNVVSVRCRLTCHRTDNIYGEGVPNDQEIPAVYPISALNNLYAYFGAAPFTGAEIAATEIIQLESGFWGIYTPDNGSFPSEKWMACVDDSGWGIGIYSPQATKFLAGRYGAPGEESTSPFTGYIAPVRVETLMKNSVSEYSYYIIVGTLDEIRAKIYQIHQLRIEN